MRVTAAKRRGYAPDRRDGGGHQGHGGHGGRRSRSRGRWPETEKRFAKKGPWTSWSHGQTQPFDPFWRGCFEDISRTKASLGGCWYLTRCGLSVFFLRPVSRLEPVNFVMCFFFSNCYFIERYGVGAVVWKHVLDAKQLFSLADTWMMVFTSWAFLNSQTSLTCVRYEWLNLYWWTSEGKWSRREVGPAIQINLEVQFKQFTRHLRRSSYPVRVCLMLRITFHGW